MYIGFATKPNVNGNIYQLEVDTKNKRYSVGYSVFFGKPNFYATKKEIDNFIEYNLKYAGYVSVIEL